MFKQLLHILLLLLTLVLFGQGQAQLNGVNQLRNIGTDLPSVCEPGAVFFKTNAAGGQNWYGCTATNTWRLQRGINHGRPEQLCRKVVLPARPFSKIDAPAGQNWFRCTATDTWTLQGNKRPWTAGAVLPATCAVGDMFFNSSATAGQNWCGCVASDAWMVQGDGNTGGGAYEGPKLPKVTFSGSTATVGSDCSATPCAAGFGSTTVPFTTSATFTITSQSDDANVAFFIRAGSPYLPTPVPDGLTTRVNGAVAGCTRLTLASEPCDDTVNGEQESVINADPELHSANAAARTGTTCRISGSETWSYSIARNRTSTRIMKMRE